jgi:hypothetical protein
MSCSIFDLRSLDMPQAYDLTQASATIRHGSVLLVPDGVAILVEAWPVMFSGSSQVFHRLAPAQAWDRLTMDMSPDDAQALAAGVAQARRPFNDLAAAALTLADLAELDELEAIRADLDELAAARNRRLATLDYCPDELEAIRAALAATDRAQA